MSRAVPSTACFAREVEDQGSGNLTLNHFPAERRSTTHRFGLNIGHDSSMRTSRHYGMRERPNNIRGLVFTDQAHPRAALDANGNSHSICCPAFVHSLRFRCTPSFRQ